MFEWDPKKDALNIRKHGVSFATASRIFLGQVFTSMDDGDHDELREVSIGLVDGIACIVVVHTDRNGKTRIISARRANPSERKRYEKAIR